MTCPSPQSADAEPEKKIGYLLARIRHIAEDEGFLVNEKKTRVLRRNTAMAVTGVIVNQPQPGVPRAYRRRLRAILHNAKKQGLASQNRANVANFESRIRGQIAYVHMINPDQARPLIEEFNSVARLNSIHKT